MVKTILKTTVSHLLTLNIVKRFPGLLLCDENGNGLKADGGVPCTLLMASIKVCMFHTEDNYVTFLTTRF